MEFSFECMDVETELRVRYLVLASCSETSRRVLICSEITPIARKAAHARPAPSPNRLVKEEAIQSVVSTVVAGFGGFCCCTFTEARNCCSDEVVLSCGDGVGVSGCEGSFGGGGGGVCDDGEKWEVLVSG